MFVIYLYFIVVVNVNNQLSLAEKLQQQEQDNTSKVDEGKNVMNA